MTRSDTPTETRRVRRAMSLIRREGWKVAVIYGVIDAALVTLLANLVVAITRPRFLPADIAIPQSALGFISRTTGITLADPTVSSGAVVGIALGVFVFGLEVAIRVRRPLVEQFEAVNPELREALRTARDAVRDGRDTRMAIRLYGTVLADLRRASSIGLLDLRRVVVTLAVISLLSVATIQVAVVDLSLPGFDGPQDRTPQDGAPPSEYEGLQDPAGILGDPEDIPGGEENLDAIIGTSGPGTDDDTGVDSPAAYESSGFTGSESIESQLAEFGEVERIEDAELIREYNLRIREDA